MRKASGVGEAGWGRTLVAAVISLIYFFPVLWIILTSFQDAQRCSRGSRPVHLHADLREFRIGIQPRLFGRRPSARHGIQPLFLQFAVHRRNQRPLALAIGTLAAFGFSRYRSRATTPIFHHPHHPHAAGDSGHHSDLHHVPHHWSCGNLCGHHRALYGFHLPFTIWMMKSFFDELSLDIEDAHALMDRPILGVL